MSYARSDTVIDHVGNEHGLPLEDFEYYSYELMTGKELLSTYKKAELAKYDVILQNCWYDPGVREGREILNIPITGICEASCHIGAALGNKFSIIVGQKKWISKMEENVVRYGFGSKIASWRDLDLHVQDLHDDHDNTLNMLIDVGTKCVKEDGAESILTACGGFEPYAEEASKLIGAPVINPTKAGVMFAEWLSDLHTSGFKFSKAITYQSPPEDKINLLL